MPNTEGEKCDRCDRIGDKIWVCTVYKLFLLQISTQITFFDLGVQVKSVLLQQLPAEGLEDARPEV